MAITLGIGVMGIFEFLLRMQVRSYGTRNVAEYANGIAATGVWRAVA